MKYMQQQRFIRSVAFDFLSCLLNPSNDPFSSIQTHIPQQPHAAIKRKWLGFCLWRRPRLQEGKPELHTKMRPLHLSVWPAKCNLLCNPRAPIHINGASLGFRAKFNNSREPTHDCAGGIDVNSASNGA